MAHNVTTSRRRSRSRLTIATTSAAYINSHGDAVHTVSLAPDDYNPTQASHSICPHIGPKSNIPHLKLPLEHF
jgi:hypothetical protein